MLLLAVIGAQAGYNFMASGSVLGAESPITTSELLTDTNKERAARGVAPLTVNPQLSQAAYMKAKDMFRQQYWAHVAPDGTTPWQWLTKNDYDYAAAGENLAKNFGSADATMAAWMDSPEHRKNVLNDRYEEVGFAVASGTLNGAPTTLVVAMYGEPATAATAVKTSVQTKAPAIQAISPLARVDVAMEAMTPAALGSVFAILLTAVVAVAAHFYRYKLPKKFRQSWYRHHGLIKASGMVSLIMIMIVLYSGGQI